MEARTGKHVLRWCIRHHKTGALDFTACRARIRVRACAHTRTRTSSDKINSATKGTDQPRWPLRLRARGQHACNARLRLFYYRYLFAAAMSRGCPASSPRRNKIRDIYEPPSPPDFENVSQRVSLSLSLPLSLSPSLFFRRARSLLYLPATRSFMRGGARYFRK